MSRDTWHVDNTPIAATKEIGEEGGGQREGKGGKKGGGEIR